MKAMGYLRYGTPDVLELQEIPKPTPTEGQVLIRVHAASVNPYDWRFLRGTPSFIRLFTGLRKPKSPRLGVDVAGVVEAVGSKVESFKLGDAVFGTAKGSFAANMRLVRTKSLAASQQALTRGHRRIPTTSHEETLQYHRLNQPEFQEPSKRADR